MNKIYADVTEDYSVDGPNFQWVVLASEAEEREATLRSDRDAEKEMKAKARSQRDVQTIRAGGLQTRLQSVQKYVEKLIDQSKNQDSVATGYLSDILDVIKGK